MKKMPIYMSTNRPKGGTDMDKVKSANQLVGNLMDKLIPNDRKLEHDSPLRERIADWTERCNKLLSDVDATDGAMMALLVDCPYPDLPKRGKLQVRILAKRSAALRQKEREPEPPVPPPSGGLGKAI